MANLPRCPPQQPYFGRLLVPLPRLIIPKFAAVKILLPILTTLLMWPALAVHAQELSTDAEPFTIGGSVALRTVAYTASGIGARRSPFSYVLSGTVTPSVYGVALPLAFTLTEQDRTTSQPLNQFGLSARHDWVAVHGGFRNPTFSNFTLAGHQMLGGGFDLSPGIFRVSVAAGQLMRAVEQDTLSLAPVLASYSRSGWAAKVGVEDSEFFVLATVLSASDDTTSLRRAPVNIDVTPGENVALGFAAGITPADGMRLDAEWALSAYTRDVRSSQITIKNGDIRTLAESILTPRLSTSVYQAFRAGLALRRPTWGLQASYSYIDPDYRSMGAYAMNTDQAVITVAPSVVLADNRLRLGLSITHIEDNLQTKKWFTTTRVQPMLTASWTPTMSFGVDASLGDVFTSQASGARPVNDSVALNNRNPMLTVSPRLSFISPELIQNISATVVSQWYIDNNPVTRQFSEYAVVTANTMYSVTLPASQLTLGAGGFVTHFDGLQGTNTSGGVTATASKQLPEHGLALGANTAVGLGASTTVNAGINGTYSPMPRHALQASLAITSATFTELTAVLGYALSF